MKLMRRVIVALLAVAMAASSLVACGKDNGTGKDELVTLDCYSQLANFQGKQGNFPDHRRRACLFTCKSYRKSGDCG